MPILKAGKFTKKAFTLIEILVVLLLISLSLSFLMPKIGSFFDKQNMSSLQELNSFLKEAFNKTLDSHEPIVVWGVKGGKALHFLGKNFSFDKDVFSVKVNNAYEQGLKYYFLIYPNGIMDKVEIKFEDDTVIVSDPLLLKFYIHKS